MPLKDRKKAREYNIQYNKEWYKRNSAKVKKDSKEYKQRTRNFITEYKREHSCEKCGEDDAICLVFHHVDPKEKEYDITQLVARGWSIERVQTEINKCVVLCANCHCKEHAALD